ncbi:MAG TPA: hypothetical protein PKV98_10090 [Burkholderiaceae bacterium]|nr:hypothetical protein [Burkholderiaceae bacterium]
MQSGVELRRDPPTIERPKRIHPRHLLPLVREGLERNIHSTTRDAKFMPRAAGPLAASADIRLAVDTTLDQPAERRTASNVGEPSCAINGKVVLYTGNWYAAISLDGGASFQYMDPATAFPDPSPKSQFCCDQVAQYIAQIDTFVWLLQYGPEDGDNIQRVAYAKTADVAQGRWRHFDITTKILGVPGAFLDFPDLAVGRSSLYVTTNVFGPGQRFGSAVVRLPLDGLRTGNVTADKPFVSFKLQSFRVAQNCGDVGYFAAHADTSTLAVFSWPEGQPTPTRTDVPVARWIGGNGYVSRTPDGRRWLDRADPRITGATLARSELWFAWSVDRRSNQRAQPFVQIARIDATTLKNLENINIFDPEAATCYAALSTNRDGEVGVSYMVGGGTKFPSHVVGILTGTRRELIVASGERGPLDEDGKGEWGDYLSVRPLFPEQRMFAATGYTMRGQGDGSNRDATPRFVTFGRSGDVGLGAPSPPAPPPPPGSPPAGDDLSKPFTDVNALATVSPQVAATIKAACMAEGAKPAPSDAEIVVPLRLVTKPGVERWPVKTGADRDIALVGKNVIDGQKLQGGIVDATIEELVRIPRPADMQPVTQLFPKYQERRRGPVEFTVWRIECDIISVTQEADGDYHLVLLGAGGKQMIGEVPTPLTPFVTADCPWLVNMKAARKAVDDKLIKQLSPHDFIQLDNRLVPREAVTEAAMQPLAMERLPVSFLTPEVADMVDMPTFAAKVKPTRARVTGVGFFDKVHGQTGVALLNGIELHPILKVEWL